MLAGLLCSLYLVLFVLGIGSNLCAFVKTISVYRWIRKGEWSTNLETTYFGSSSPVKHFILFTVVLVTTNFALLLCLCFLMSDVLAQGWHLGSTLCWFYWWSENVAKVFVAFLLSAFSVERYFHAVNEQKWRLWSSSVILWTLIVMACVLVIVLAAPLQPYVGVQTVIVDPTVAELDGENLTKCAINEIIPKWTLRYHVVGSFAFAYGLPLTVSVYCYVSIVRHWRKSNLFSNENQSEYLNELPSITSTSTTTTTNLDQGETIDKRISFISAALVGMYLLCWSPYWLTTLAIQFGDLSQTSAFNLPFALFICHVLPYVYATVSGLLFLALIKRMKLLRLSDMTYDPQIENGRESEVKTHYEMMIKRENQ